MCWCGCVCESAAKCAVNVENGVACISSLQLLWRMSIIIYHFPFSVWIPQGAPQAITPALTVPSQSSSPYPALFILSLFFSLFSYTSLLLLAEPPQDGCPCQSHIWGRGQQDKRGLFKLHGERNKRKKIKQKNSLFPKQGLDFCFLRGESPLLILPSSLAWRGGGR